MLTAITSPDLSLSILAIACGIWNQGLLSYTSTWKVTLMFRAFMMIASQKDNGAVLYSSVLNDNNGNTVCIFETALKFRLIANRSNIVDDVKLAFVNRTVRPYVCVDLVHYCSQLVC